MNWQTNCNVINHTSKGVGFLWLNSVIIIIYKYIYSQCNNEQEISKPIADYNREETCTKCNGILKRDPQDFCKNFDTSKITGFFGKSTRW